MLTDQVTLRFERIEQMQEENDKGALALDLLRLSKTFRVELTTGLDDIELGKRFSTIREELAAAEKVDGVIMLGTCHSKEETAFALVFVSSENKDVSAIEIDCQLFSIGADDSADVANASQMTDVLNYVTALVRMGNS